MIQKEFLAMLSESMGEERAARLASALETEAEVSVRVNPFKMTLEQLREHFAQEASDPVPWAAGEAFYLKHRVSFTLDPLFHAGGYYVQEASSMYVGKLLEDVLSFLGRRTNLRVLDLCAAPGGKTTQLLSHLMARRGETPTGNRLISNEVMGARVAALYENTVKWGCGGVIVTNSDPSRFGGEHFDIVVVDAPCSGEGMFRKDEKAQACWSPANVKLCAQRQRRILSDIWPSLEPGGYMIYSTCTFNHFEDEDIVEWICSELGGRTIEMRHFYPGEDRGEGFFAALLQKDGDGKNLHSKPISGKGLRVFEAQFPMADEALSVDLPYDKYPRVELSREDALKFLSKDTLVFRDRPTGYLLLTYKGLGLGFVKNLGNRANNLHPMPRRIRQRL